MLTLLWHKIKEALISVLPVTLIVLIMYFTPLLSLSSVELTVFLVAALFLILGIGLFNLGANMAMHPIGEQMGSSIIKTKKIWLVLLISFIMGLLITIAEPDLTVLANQVASLVNSTSLILCVGLGVGFFLVIGILKIIYKKDLSMLLMLFYLMLFCIVSLLVIEGNSFFLPLSFDSGGVTTGPITVPFIMAFGLGIASTVGGKDNKENSFGLVALCSIGPILAMLILGINVNGGSVGIGDYTLSNNIFSTILKTLFGVAEEISLVLGLIVISFLVINFIFIKLSKKKLIQIGIGICYTFFGLLLFLTAVSIGFMPIGYKIGNELASNNGILITVGFILGLVVVLAEPAVHVLTRQVEEVTMGGISKKSLLISLSIGVGISLGLSMIRIVFKFPILYYLIPGYVLSLSLSIFVPKMYTAIAFDSGGVASGPLTSSFILPLAVGACMQIGGVDRVLYDAFGVVAMVAMTPLITIQLLGFKAVMVNNVKRRIRTRKILNADDEQFIRFK